MLVYRLVTGDRMEKPTLTNSMWFSVIMIPMSISQGDKNERKLPADAKFGREMAMDQYL